MLLLSIFLQANAMNGLTHQKNGMSAPSAGQAQQQLYVPYEVTHRIIPQFMQAYEALSPGFELEKMKLLALFTQTLNLLANQNKKQIQEIAELRKTLLQERKQHLKSQQNALGQLQTLQTHIIMLVQENECVSQRNKHLSEQFLALNNLIVHKQSSPEHPQRSPEPAPEHYSYKQPPPDFTQTFFNL